MRLLLGVVSTLCIIVSVFACFFLCNHYRSVPVIKKNILTRLDEMLIINFTFFVLVQCLVSIFSLLSESRSEYLYLAFYAILYGSLAILFGIGLGLSFARVFIIIWVSYVSICRNMHLCMGLY